MTLLRLDFGKTLKRALVFALLSTLVFQPFTPLVAFGATVGEVYTFDSPGASSWAVPDGVSSIKVRVWGGGGAGGTGEKINETHRAGLGGGAGAYSEKTIAVNGGENYTIVVGAGGQGYASVEDGRVGNPGQESRFEGHGHALAASGGTGGASFTGGGNPTEPIGMGGSATGGDVNLSGGNGGGYSVDIDGNPYASNGGGSPNGGAGGARGRCGVDGGCNGSEPGSPLAQSGGFPGGGGGGSDVGLGGYGGNGQVTIEVVGAGADPFGHLDEASCDNIGGWAYDADDSAASVAIHFYTEDASGNMTFIGETLANILREDVNAAQNITGNHGFNFATPANLKDGNTHTIHAYGINLGSGANKELLDSPKQISGCTGGPGGGGGGTTPSYTASLVASVSCALPGAPISFTVSVSGTGVTSIVLEKDTNGDDSWGEVASWGAPGTFPFQSFEPASYTGTYRLRLIVNGDTANAKIASVTVGTCPGTGGGGTTNPAPVFTTPLTVSPSSVGVGGQAALMWAAQNATSCTASNGWSGVYPVVGNNFIVGPITQTTTYTLTCTGPGGSVSSSATLTYNPGGGGGTPGGGAPGGGNPGGGTTYPAPVFTVPLTVSPSSVGANSQASVQWAVSNAASCIASNGWSGIYPITGSGYSVGPITQTTTYTLTCTGPGGSVSSSATLVYNPGNGGGDNTTGPIVGTLAAASSCVAAGTAMNFTASVSGAGVTSVVLEKDTDGNGVFGPVYSAGSVGTYTYASDELPTYTGTYTLRLLVNGVETQRQTVTVGDCGNNGGSQNGGDEQNTGGSSRSGGRSGGSTFGAGGRCLGYGCPTDTTIPGDILIYIDTPTSGGDYPPASNGIAGPEKVCPAQNFITTFLKRGIDNDPNEVRKLQYFLNTYENAGLDVSGEFDLATETAVKALQVKHGEAILAPWGVTEPTGIVYITTTRHINTVYCNDHPGYTGNEDIKDIIDSSVLYPTIDNSGDFEGDIGLLPTTTPDRSNIAGLFVSISQKIENFLKDIPWYQTLILILLVLGACFITSIVFKKEAPTIPDYMSLIRGSAVLAVGTVLNVLNTIAYIANPEWFVEKTGITLSWLLALDALNLGIVALISLAVLISMYGRLVQNGGRPQ